MSEPTTLALTFRNGHYFVSKPGDQTGTYVPYNEYRAIEDTSKANAETIAALCALLHLPPDASADEVTGRVKGLVEALIEARGSIVFYIAEKNGVTVDAINEMFSIRPATKSWTLGQIDAALGATGK